MYIRLAVLPGDGIGPEVVAAAERVLAVAAARFDHQVDSRRWPIGGAALRLDLPALPHDTVQACSDARAVFLGAVGDPAFDDLPREARIETALLLLRERLGVFANLRPARAWPGLEESSPFKPERIAGTNLLIVRELLGGLYFGEPRGLDDDGAGAYNTLRYSEPEVARVADIAFTLAAGRRGRVTSVDKANVLETSQLWRRVVKETAPRFPAVVLEHQYVDACAMMLALDPRHYDVILTENMFGDILSDEAGAIAGSLGLLPSASLGSGPALYEPVHGSAPTLAGRDVANPIGAILSVALMFRHSFQAEEEAAAIEHAVADTLASGARTIDLVPSGSRSLTCSEMARAIADRLAQAS
ncbi:MAG: 3-isopropylmalate dehydrogenase [Luteitalea sp.]|nr:3-isopropylmalate dehydrogenase [Luteitalea sp.]